MATSARALAALCIFAAQIAGSFAVWNLSAHAASDCPARDDLTSSTGIRPTSLTNRIATNLEFFGFEPPLPDLTEYFADASPPRPNGPASLESGVFLGAVPMVPPSIVSLADEATVFSTNHDASFAIASASDGVGYAALMSEGPGQQTVLQSEALSGTGHIRFTAMLGYVLATDEDRSRFVSAQFTISQHGTILYSADLNDARMLGACLAGGNFDPIPGGLPAGVRPVLKRCGPVTFDVFLQPATQTTDPLVLRWELTSSTDFSYDYPNGCPGYLGNRCGGLMPLAVLSLDDIKIDYVRPPDPVCQAYRSTDHGFCKLPGSSPWQRLRIVDQNGNERYYGAGVDPSADSSLILDFMREPGIYRFDGICVGQRSNGKAYLCGQSAQEADYWVEPQRPIPVLARLSDTAAIIFPPMESCYTQGANSYEIWNAQGKVATVPAESLARDGYILPGLRPETGEIFHVVPIYSSSSGGTVRGLPGGWDAAYWQPLTFQFSLNHFPVPGRPAEIHLTGEPLTYYAPYPKRLRLAVADSPSAGNSALGFGLPGPSAANRQYSSFWVGAQGSATPALNASIAVVDPLRSAPLQSNLLDYQGVAPTQDFWIVSGELDTRLNDAQRSAALRYFGDPRSMEGDFGECFFDDPALLARTPSLSPALNLCQCSFMGNHFDCKARSPSNVLMVSLPTPEPALGDALSAFYFRSERLSWPGPPPISFMSYDGLLNDPEWLGFMLSLQSGAGALYPPGVTAVNRAIRPGYALGFGTYDYLRMLAWDREPGHNLFRAGSSFGTDWLSALDVLFYQRYVRPMKEIPFSAPNRPSFDRAEEEVVRLLFKLDDGYAAIQGHKTPTLDAIERQAMRDWITDDEASDPPGAWDFPSRHLTNWPGEMIPDDCPNQVCPADSLPKCDNFQDYSRKLTGYSYQGRQVPGYLDELRSIKHVRSSAFAAVENLIDRFLSEHKIDFLSDEPGTEATTPMPFPYAYTQDWARPTSAWQEPTESVPSPSLRELRDAVGISLSHWYCRGHSREASKVLLHEGVHAYHALKVYFDPATLAILDSASDQAELDKMIGFYLIWTEFRAYRMEYCTEAKDYGPQGACSNDRAFFNAVFFGARFPGHVARVPDGLLGPRPFYTQQWALNGLCRQGICRTIDDVLQLPTADLCNPFTGERGDCPDLP